MPSVVNQKMMREVEKRFEESEFAFFSSFDKLSVAVVSELRNKLTKAGVQSLVVKHALAKKILKAKDADAASKFFKKLVFVTFGNAEPQNVSKTLVEFEKANQQFVSAGVFFENRVYDAQFVKQLANLPSKHELLTQMVVRMKSPLSGVVLTLSALLRSLAVALQEVKKKKEAQAS